MISELLKKYSPNAIRYMLLSHHYHTPWEYKEPMIIKASKKTYALEQNMHSSSLSQERQNNKELIAQFNTAMQNDLDTPQALQIMDKAAVTRNFEALKTISGILGFTF